MEGTQDIIPVFYAGTAVMLALAFGLIFLVLFYQGNLARIRRAEAEHLLRVSIESEQQERRRIAADLHDGVCGDLSAIKYYLAMLEKKQSGSGDMLREIRDGIDNALDNTRMVSYKLMPPLLESLGFVAALGDNFERLSARTEAAFSVRGTEPGLPVSIHYELYRVVQEFTTNMIKYGAISRCAVLVSGSEKYAEIVIEDDGAPYDFFALAESSRGSGLKNITTRLRAVSGTLVQNKVPEGNRFTIKISK